MKDIGKYIDDVLETFDSQSKVFKYLEKYKASFDEGYILEKIAAKNTEEYNRFVSNIRFVDIAPMKTEKEIVEEKCGNDTEVKTEDTKAAPSKEETSKPPTIYNNDDNPFFIIKN
jgi:hypothetical protein